MTYDICFLLKIRKMATKQTLEIDYTKYDFHNSDESYEYKFQKGLSRETVGQISKIKHEPEWMLQFRLRSYDHFLKRPMPTWGGDLTTLKFDEMIYYASSTEKKSRSWTRFQHTSKIRSINLESRKRNENFLEA